VAVPAPPQQPPRNMPEFNQFGFGQGPVFQAAPVGHPGMGMWGGVPPWMQQAPEQGQGLGTERIRC